MSVQHVIRYTHYDGGKLDVPILWCGMKGEPITWYFQDAQHAALSVEGSIAPCKKCLKVIIKQLEKGL